MRNYDAILLYDMPGLDFSSPVESRPEPVAPPPEFVEGIRALLDEGKGIVALHHAIAGWPAYAEMPGGAFLYRPAIVRFRSACHAVRKIDDERDWVPPAAFADPTYRTLVGNALRWVASPEARAWVDERTHGRDHHPSTGMASSTDHSAAAAPAGAEYA